MIIITPGHYASAPGANNGEGFDEFSEAQKWAKSLMHCLGDQGIFVPGDKLTRKVERINKLCKEHDVKLCLEVHFNAASDSMGFPIGRGSEVLYCPGSKKGKTIATKVQGVIAKSFKPDRGVKEGWYRRRKTNGPLYILKHTVCPAIIIEPEFIWYPEKIEKGRDKCCKDISAILLNL